MRRYLAFCAEHDAPTLARDGLVGFVAALLEAGAEPATARSRQLAVRRFSAWLLKEGGGDLEVWFPDCRKMGTVDATSVVRESQGGRPSMPVKIHFTIVQSPDGWALPGSVVRNHWMRPARVQQRRADPCARHRLHALGVHG